MAETMEALAAALEAALPARAAKADCGCGCGGKKTSASDDDLALPAVTPPLAALTSELSTALEADFLGGATERGDADPGPVADGDLGGLLELLQAHPGLKITLSF